MMQDMSEYFGQNQQIRPNFSLTACKMYQGHFHILQTVPGRITEPVKRAKAVSWLNFLLTHFTEYEYASGTFFKL